MNWNMIYYHLKNKKLYLGVLAIVALCAVLFFCFSSSDSNVYAAQKQLLTLTDNIRNAYRNKPDAWGLNTFSAIKNNIVPQNMLKDGQIINALAKEILIGADVNGNTVMPGSRNFDIIYKNLNYDECVALAQFDFDEKNLLGVASVSIINKNIYLFDWTENNSLPLSKDICQKSCSEKNDIIWYMYL